MGERWKRWKSERFGLEEGSGSAKEYWENKIKPLLKKDNLILIVLAGILLLVISLPTEKEKNGEEKDGAGKDTPSRTERTAVTPAPLTGGDAQTLEEQYRRKMEEELTAFLKTIDGAGEVKVMITLQTSQELVALREEKAQQKKTRETDSSGGTRFTEDTVTEDTVIYDTASQEKSPYVVKTVYPRVEGVVVAATGVGSGRVRTDLTEAVQALFGLQAHKVKVLKMGNISFETGIE